MNSTEAQQFRKLADLLEKINSPESAITEDASTYSDNAEQARAIMYLCGRYIEACNSENEELAYSVAAEIVQLALELQKAEEYHDTEEEWLELDRQAS